MSCTSCGVSSNSCSCTTYQLPTGPTGAGGSQGPTGATGPAGAVVLADIQVNQANTTTGSYETLYTYALSNPSQLDEVGDILEIYSYWSEGSPSTAWRPIRIRIGNNNIAGVGWGLISGSFYNQTKVSLSKVTSSTVSLSTQELVIAFGGTVLLNGFTHIPNQVNTSYQAVNNGATTLDTGVLNIDFQGYGSAVGDIHLDRIVILKLEKQ